MADRHIDMSEILIYTPTAAAAIVAHAKGKIASFDGALDHVAAVLTARAEAVATELGGARTADAGTRKGSQEKVPGLAAAFDALKRFRKHLEAHAKGTVDVKVFFTKDGTVGGVGKAAAKVLHGLAHIAAELEKPGCPVKDAAAWRTEILAVHAALDNPTTAASGAKATRKEITPALAKARDEWNQAYVAAKLVVEGILRLTDGLALLPEIFPDLAVRPRRRAPATAPA